MYLKTIKELAYKRYTEYSDSDIKESECAVEAYFNSHYVKFFHFFAQWVYFFAGICYNKG